MSVSSNKNMEKNGRKRMYQTVGGFNEFVSKKMGLTAQFKGLRVTKANVVQFFAQHNIPDGYDQFEAHWKEQCNRVNNDMMPEAPVIVEPIPQDNVMEVETKMTVLNKDETKTDLKLRCVARGIKVLSKDTKKDLLEKLNQAANILPIVVQPDVVEEPVAADILARSMVELGDTRHLIDCYVVDKATDQVTGKVDLNDPNLVERELTKEDIDHVISLNLCPIPSM